MTVQTDLATALDTYINSGVFVGALPEVSANKKNLEELLNILETVQEGSTAITANSAIEFNAGVTTAKTQRIAIATNANTVRVGTAPASKLVTLTFTRVANTTSYAIDDQWGDLRQEAGFGIAGEGYWLTAINLVSSLATLPTGYGSFSLFIFNSSTNAGTGIADNDPFTRRPFAVQSGSGINLNTPVKNTNDATANSFTGGLREQIHLVGTDLWFRLVTRTAITSPLAAADTITLTLRFAGMS